jgi:signal transduction histidine kinase
MKFVDGLDLVGIMPDEVELSLFNWGWLALTLLGLSLLGTVYYFRSQSKRLRKALARLYSLNQTVEQDALSFFHQAWPILASVGCLQMKASVEWFGEKRTVNFGVKRKLSSRKTCFKVARDDMSFEIILFLNRGASEPESLSSLVIKTFIKILEQDLVLKEAEILTSQKRLERYQMYVQHEIKNIAQFIQLLSEQVALAESEASKVRLVNTLRETIPLMAKRARKTIQQMNQPLSEAHESSFLMIRSILQEVLQMYSLEANIVGDASVNLSRQLLLEVFKNILGNFSDHPSSDQPIKIIVETEGQDGPIHVKIIGQLYGLQNEMVPERIFEPFWTTSESGMGLGLFLSRELLKQFDGQIAFEQSVKEFSFLVTLPGLVK